MRQVCTKPKLSATLVFRPDPRPGEPPVDVYLSAPDDIALIELRARLAWWAQCLTIQTWKARARQSPERAA